MLLLEPTGESECFRWLFLCRIGHTAYSVSFSPWKSHVMLCRGLSKCLHLLMWVNQHRRTVGVWIPNPWGVGVLSLDGFFCFFCSFEREPGNGGSVSGVRATRQEPLTARNADGQRSGEADPPLFHAGDPASWQKARRSPRVSSAVAAYFPPQCKSKFLSVL